MDDVWVPLKDFPKYDINLRGEVRNALTGRIIKPSLSSHGLPKVGLIYGGRQYTRLVRTLVAEMFVSGQNDIFNTPINLDGDPMNNHATNLLWRPRWFAYKYHRQFDDLPPYHEIGPVFDLGTQIEYFSVYDVATKHGLLMGEVWKSIHFKTPVFPTNQLFDLNWTL